MTVVHSFAGYGEHDYGSQPYGGGTAQGAMGFQFEAVIKEETATGAQFEGKIIDQEAATGLQFEALVDTTPVLGIQFESLVLSQEQAAAFQFEGEITPNEFATGVEFFGSNMGFIDCGATYGSTPYGTTPYGKPTLCAALGFQFDAKIVGTQTPTGFQFDAQITDVQVPIGIQFEGKIIDFPGATGLQFESIATSPLGLQFTINLYNTDRLRVLCEFPSRGAATGSGTNAWGNAIATGQNWLASSTKAGDFGVNNLNTDIVEQIWRSDDGVVTGINLDCDTEIAQGVFLDTLAILNHNLTTSATVNVIGSNSATFTPVGTTFVLNVRPDNIFHIESVLPLSSFRYWRISIDDSTNPDGFISIGTIVFGAAIIFQGECLVDRILKRSRHFADTVRTEGFTSVKNDRALKNSVRLDFRSLDFNKGNFKALSNIFKTTRTSQKCLWIPTPSLSDPTFMERFAVFAKLVEIPEESHNVKGPDLDFIDLTLDLDEAE